MLYHPLRRTMIGIQTALENFAGHTGPDFLETAPPELKTLLDSLELTLHGLRNDPAASGTSQRNNVACSH
ncbi:MAG: hypothetical protein KDA79_19400 [Planctomycetaceae bacterium]|nr:hypothetical protein [Planctomycetaceae bacterium]